MELRQLHCFVAVAEELNFHRAAEKLFMEQPPLSRQIQRLEAELGVLLFQRSKHHVALTAAGLVFLGETRQTLAQINHATLMVQRVSRESEKRLAVGYFISSCSFAFDSTFPKVMSVFRKQCPDASITLNEMCSINPLRALNSQETDVGFLQVPAMQVLTMDESLASICLLQEALVLALPEDHPLAALPAVPMDLLAEEKFVLSDQRLYPAARQEIVSACRQAGYCPRVILEVVSSQHAVALVGMGLGITLVYASLTRPPPPGVVYRRVPDLLISSQLLAVWRSSNKSPLVIQFVDLVKQMF